MLPTMRDFGIAEEDPAIRILTGHKTITPDANKEKNIFTPWKNIGHYIPPDGNNATQIVTTTMKKAQEISQAIQTSVFRSSILSKSCSN